MTIRQYATKVPAEVDRFAVDFAANLNGATISTASVQIGVSRGTDASVGTMPQGAPTISGSQISQLISAGVSGNVYLLRFQANLSDGRILVEWGYITVQDPA